MSTTNQAASKAHTPSALFLDLAKHDKECRFGAHAVSITETPAPVQRYIPVTSVLVSKQNPGYHTYDLTNRNSDEAIARILGTMAITKGRAGLEAFRVMLSTPGRFSLIVKTLWPRPNTKLDDRSYEASPSVVRGVVKTVLADKVTEPALIDAYGYACVRLFTMLGLLLPDDAQRYVVRPQNYVVTTEDIAGAMMMDALKEVFSEARLAGLIAQIKDKKITPVALGAHIEREFVMLASLIPEIQLRAQRLDLAMKVVYMYLVREESLPLTIRSMPSLVRLAGIANFVASVSKFSSKDVGSLVITADQLECERALDAVATVIASTPSFESLDMASYTALFGFAPASGTQNFRHGAVVYRHLGQKSVMNVVSAMFSDDGSATKLLALAPSYVPAVQLAAQLNTGALSASSKHALVNIVADELAHDIGERIAEKGFTAAEPQLWTIDMSEDDLAVLAMAKAKGVALTAPEGGQVSMVFAVDIEEGWRFQVAAATPVTAFMTKPAAVVLFTSSADSVMPKALPARSQVFDLKIGEMANFVNILQGSGAEQVLSGSLATKFRSKVSLLREVANANGQKVNSLELDFYVLGELIGYTDDAALGLDDSSMTSYRAIREPGVDAELRTMITLALKYAEKGSLVTKDKAISWLIQTVGPLMATPAVRIAASNAVNMAIAANALNVRNMREQYRALVIKAHFAAALALLSKFGKLDPADVARVVAVMPMSNLETSAKILLDQIGNLSVDVTVR